MIRIAWYAFLILITLAFLFLLWHFSVGVVIFIFSLAVAAAFGPAIKNMRERGLPKWLALLISYGVVLLVFAAIGLVASGPLIRDLQTVVDDLVVIYDRTKLGWMNADSSFLNSLADQLPSTQELFGAATGEDSELAIQTVFGVAEGTFEFFSRLVIVLILSLYWNADQARFERLALSLMPVDWRTRARHIWQEIQFGVGAYLRREFTLSIIAGLALWLGFNFMGVPYASLLAFTGALIRLIPWLGYALVIVVPLLVGLGSGWSIGITAGVFSLLVFILLENLLSPKLFSRLRYNSLVLVIIVIALADSYGLLGAVFGPPLAVTLQIMFQNLLATQENGARAPEPRNAEDLRAKMDTIKQKTAALEGSQASQTVSLANRLERLIENGLSDMEEEPETAPRTQASSLE